MKNPETTVQELHQIILQNKEHQLIDVREPHEYETANLNGLNIPMGEVMERLNEIRRDVPVIVHCRSGARSAAIVNALEQNADFNNLSNLKGGILAWIAEIDPNLQS